MAVKLFRPRARPNERKKKKRSEEQAVRPKIQTC